MRRSRVLVSLLGIVVAATAASAASVALPTSASLSTLLDEVGDVGVPVRDTWHVMRDGDVIWGAQRIRVSALDDGRFVHVGELRALMEVFGMKQETRAQSTVVVDAAFAPLRVESEMTQHSGTVRIEAELVGRSLRVRKQDGAEIVTSEHLVDDTPPLVADVALDAWLHAQPDDVDTVRLRLFGAGSGDVREVVAERVATADSDGVTWLIDRGAIPGEVTIRVGLDGVTVEQSMRFPPIHVERHPDASTVELTHRPFSDRELLVHTADRPLPPMRRIETLVVELRWRDVDPSLVTLSDSRQSVRSLDVDADDEVPSARAVVELRRPGAVDFDGTLPIDPAAAPGLERYLGVSDFVEPHDPEIVRVAAEIVGDLTRADEAAEAICRWVASTITPTMIAETLSGPDVLRRRIGKCTEYSTLYASLARSAGIPTRIALGQRLFGEGDSAMWGGHMWNEVWLGEWIPVDASAGEFGGSPALLKFVDSAGVVGTQDVRWRLTDGLEVSILEVTERSPRVTGDLVDGLHDGVWTSVARGVRVALPDAGWRVDETADHGATVLRIRPPADEDPGDAAMIHLVLLDLPPGFPVETLHQVRMNGHRSQVTAIEGLVESRITVAGAPGHRCSFVGIPDRAPPLHVTEVLWSADGTGLVLNLIASEALHDDFVAHLDRIVASFEALDAPADR